MAYLRVGENNDYTGFSGCGPTCSCRSCRAGDARLGEWYVPDDDDEPQPASKASEPGRTGAWEPYPLGFGEAISSSRVAFVPGIMGSTLVDGRDGQVLWGDARMLTWLPRIQEWIARMRQGNGIDNAGDVDAVDFFSIHSPVHKQDLDPYGPMIAEFERRLGPANVLKCPYDWRLSNEVSAQSLKRRVESAWPDAATNAARRGTIVAHSMGGLVARWYIEKLGGHRYVKRLVTVGTPHHGAPKAIQILMEVGAAAALLTFLAPSLSIAPLLGMAGPILRALRKMVNGFASIYQLMPDFDCVYPSLTAAKREPIAATFNKLRTSPLLNPVLGPPSSALSLIRGPRASELRRLNAELLRHQGDFTRLLPGLNVSYVCLAGYASETPVALRTPNPLSYVGLTSRCGDGTVPMRSAVLPASSAVRALFTGTRKEHGALFWDMNVQRVCLNATLGIADVTAGASPRFASTEPACAPSRPKVPFVRPLPSPQQAAEWVRRKTARAGRTPGELEREAERGVDWLRREAEQARRVPSELVDESKHAERRFSTAEPFVR